MIKNFIFRHQGQYLWTDIRVTYDTETGSVIEIGMTPEILGSHILSNNNNINIMETQEIFETATFITITELAPGDLFSGMFKEEIDGEIFMMDDSFGFLGSIANIYTGDVFFLKPGFKFKVII